MGEARNKEAKRRAHAESILNAFESWIVSIIRDEQSDAIEDRVRRTELYEALVDRLVTPPPV